MHADGSIVELSSVDGLHAARINCPLSFAPAPGQYLLARQAQSDAPLSAVVYCAERVDDGFVSAPGLPDAWQRGNRLHLRGPLGHGFTVPKSARRVALIAWDDGPRRLLALLETVARQEASVTLVCQNPPEELPLQVEVLPLKALGEVLRWADYAAFDAARESLPALKDRLQRGLLVAGGAQVLVRTPMPCGGLARCGVCTCRARAGSLLACEDGPVFDASLLDLEG